MNKKLLVVGFSIALVITTIISSISLAAPPSLIVSTNEAKIAAQDKITIFASEMEWDVMSSIGDPIQYYTPDGVEAAYEYPVETNGKDTGFILVSARKDWMPVLEWSDGIAPSSLVEYARESAIEEGYLEKGDNSEPTFYYWGAFTYSVQFGKKMKQERVVISLKNGQVTKLPKNAPKLQMDTSKAQNQWNNLIGDESKHPIKSLVNTLFQGSKVKANADVSQPQSQELGQTIYNVGGVPCFYQGWYVTMHGDDHDGDADEYPDCLGYPDDLWNDYDGCAPIAGAMILGYWSEQGYTNIPDPDAGETEDILIDHCHGRMGTWDDGTTSPDSNIVSGLEYITDTMYGYDFAYGYGGVDWDWAKQQINYGRPFVLSAADFEGGDDHAVCVYGYSDSSPYSLHVWNTWNTNNHWVQYGDWYAANVIGVAGGY